MKTESLRVPFETAALKVAVVSSLLTLAASGCAVLVFSEELDELLALCNRLHVIARGRLSPSLPRSQASVERVGAWMSGLWEAEASPAAA